MPCDKNKKLEAALTDKWKTDISYDALDDNCAHNVGYFLKEYDLLDNWEGDKNEVNDDDFMIPEGDVYDDWLAKDDSWECTEPGYLNKVAGKSLFDSWTKDKPEGESDYEGESGSSS